MPSEATCGGVTSTRGNAGGPVKPVALRARRRSAQDISHRSSRPAATLSSPKKRICPSPNCMICTNVRRQPEGEMKGIRPSITSTKAQAVQNVSLSNAQA